MVNLISQVDPSNRSAGDYLLHSVSINNIMPMKI